MNTPIPFIAVLTMGFLTSGLAQAPFTRITTGDVVTESHASFGCSLVDYDADGYPDVFAANIGRNCLYHNDGGFQFTKVTTGLVVTDAVDPDGGVWADFDNDGNLDLFVVNWESPAKDFFYLNDGGGNFTRVTQGAWVNDSSPGNGAAWADFDNDGFVDLYVANIGTSSLWKNNGQGAMTLVSSPLTSSHQDSQCAWADYDNDGDSDLFVSCFRENDLLFQNLGNGSFTQLLGDPPTDDGTDTGAVAWGDYDNDGYFDLLVCARRHTRFLYHNNGDGTFTRILEGPLVNDPADFMPGAAWADYDNDGFLDLFVSNQAGPSLLYHNERDGTFSQVTEGELVNDDGHHGMCAFADFDNDGFLDLYVCHEDYYGGFLPEPNSLYRNQGNSNGWTIVRLVGTVSNRAAIGAKIRMHATIWGKPVRQLRQISGGEGGSQCDLRAHFGLGDATKIDTLRVEWPSGIVQELQNVPVKQILTITEPAQLVPLGPDEFQIRCWKGMQFEVQKSANLETWNSLGTVTNESGTLTFQDSQGDPGTASCFYRVVSQ